MDAGVASAMVNTMQQVGGSIGTALLSSIFASAVPGTRRRTRGGRRLVSVPRAGRARSGSRHGWICEPKPRSRRTDSRSMNAVLAV